MSPEDSVTQWIFMFATMSGAAIFIFVMGHKINNSGNKKDIDVLNVYLCQIIEIVPPDFRQLSRDEGVWD